ncbi:MAG: hypothetical protein WCL50_12465 [Spirochaetota bacterium]
MSSSLRRLALLPLLLLSALSAFSQTGSPQATVSEKKDLAIFGLGYYGMPIPLETFGNIDVEVQKVFVDLGRFNVLGIQQRLSALGLDEFIEAIRKAKQSNVTIPEKYQFGEAILTEADWNRLVGAFIVAAPVVTSFNSQYNQKTFQWETDLKVNVTFIDVAAGGSVLGIGEVTTKGTNKQTQFASIRSAIEGIPSQLQYEIRKLPAFQLSSQILVSKNGEIKMALGRNMGVMVGDEYSIVVGGMVAGLRDDREVGLLVVKDVGAEVSTGRAVFGGSFATAGAQLKEIARKGFDIEPYLHLVGTPGAWALLPGARAVASRGFYDLRPYAAAQIPVGQVIGVFTALFIPVNVTVGGEYNVAFDRLTLTPWGGIGASYVHFMEAISSTSTDTDYLSHVGVQAYLKASWLVTRDLRVFAEGGIEYWVTVSRFFNPYGGFGVGAGAALKL